MKYVGYEKNWYYFDENGEIIISCYFWLSLRNQKHPRILSDRIYIGLKGDTKIVYCGNQELTNTQRAEIFKIELNKINEYAKYMNYQLKMEIIKQYE